MRSKKNKKANLERRKPTLLLIGLVLSMAFVLESFEWLGSKPLSASLESELAQEMSPENIVEVDFIKPKDEVVAPIKKTVASTVSVTKNPNPVPGPVAVSKKADNMPDVNWDDLFSGGEGDDDIVIEVIDSLFIVVEDMPEFPGGIKAMYSYLGKNIKYPKISAEAGSQGQAYVNFTIERNGEITDVKILGGSADKFCKKEAERVVQEMPKWKAGMQRGKKVRVSYTLPVRFVLD